MTIARRSIHSSMTPVRSIVGLVFCWLAAFWLYSPTRLHAQAQPNIVVIMTDDQRWDSLQYMATVQSELIQNGVNFTNSFVTTPLCCPSRASFFTGRYSHNHGVLSNSGSDGGATHFNDSSTVATWLKNAGYRTALVGKYLNDYNLLSPYIPPGWDDWRAFVETKYYNYQLNENGTISTYGAASADYSTDVLATKAANFIHSTAGQPFLLWFSPYAPHAPFAPARRHLGLFNSLGPLRPPNYNEADVSDKPNYVQNYSQLTLPEQAAQDEDIKDQLETLLSVDQAIGTIVQALKDIGQDSNTIIIFTSDNGLMWGEHRLRNTKGMPYEESIRVPFVIRHPGMTGAPGQENALALNIDIAPTIAELAGVSIPSPVDGMSLVPLLNETATTWRDDFLVEYISVQTTSMPRYGGVRSSEWKYLEYYNGERELYDLIADPYELTNLVSNPIYSPVIAALEPRLQELKATGTSNPPLIISNAALPIAIAGVPYSAQLSFDGGVGPFTWTKTIGNLPTGLSLNATTGLITGNPTLNGTYPFIVRLTDSQGNWDITVITLQVGPITADLAITQIDAPDPVAVGSNLTYSINVVNNGPGNATGALVTDTLPADVLLVSAVSSQGSCSGTATVQCDLGFLANGASASVTLVIQPTLATALTNTASVSATESDPNTANNSSTVITIVNEADKFFTADLAITQTDAPDPATVGNNLTYSINVVNNGPDSATGVTVTDTLPANVQFVSAVSSQGSCSGTAAVSCALGTLANGASATVTLVVQPTVAATLTNTASVSATENDPYTTNNSATVATTVNALTADLAITQTDAPDPVTVGGNLTYTISVVNNGPSSATEVIVTDALPANVLFVSVVSSQGSCSGTSAIHCNLGTLAAGFNATITLVVQPSLVGTVTNAASVSATESDPNSSNNSASITTTVNGNTPDLAVGFVGNPPTSASRGASFVLTDTVQNLADGLAAASTLRFYLSQDKKKDAGDALMVGERSVPQLAGFASSTGSTSVTIPVTTAIGKYTIVACADDTNLVPETVENNNCKASTKAVTIN